MEQKIAIIGEGYVGSSFQEEANKNENITVFGKDKISFGEIQAFKNMEKTLEDYTVVVNCIAKSNTRYCEENYKEAYYSNVTIPRILGNYCHETNKKFVHISTGCLYDVNSQPQSETDFLVAHCNYTLTKWQAEKELEDFPNTLIVRPRLLFDDRYRPVNLLYKLEKFDKLCNELDSITSIPVLKTAILKLIEADCTGVFNVACDGYTSMWEIGRMLKIHKPQTSIQEIRLQQGLHLVNNVMDISKLKHYYQPPNILDEIKRCW